MRAPTPRFLLVSHCSTEETGGRWRFVLESLDGPDMVEVEDIEPDAYGERLELLTVVRGLEALDQPSQVTLVTPSRYVVRGVRFGLEEWKSSRWKWERHGAMVSVRDHDLWKRLDRAMSVHDVRLRQWRIDAAHSDLAPCGRNQRAPKTPAPVNTSGPHFRLADRLRLRMGAWKQRVGELFHPRGLDMAPNYRSA